MNGWLANQTTIKIIKDLDYHGTICHCAIPFFRRESSDCSKYVVSMYNTEYSEFYL